MRGQFKLPQQWRHAVSSQPHKAELFSKHHGGHIMWHEWDLCFNLPEQLSLFNSVFCWASKNSSFSKPPYQALIFFVYCTFWWVEEHFMETSTKCEDLTSLIYFWISESLEHKDRLNRKIHHYENIWNTLTSHFRSTKHHTFPLFPVLMLCLTVSRSSSPQL